MLSSQPSTPRMSILPWLSWYKSYTKSKLRLIANVTRDNISYHSIQILQKHDAIYSTFPGAPLELAVLVVDALPLLPPLIPP